MRLTRANFVGLESPVIIVLHRIIPIMSISKVSKRKQDVLFREEHEPQKQQKVAKVKPGVVVKLESSDSADEMPSSREPQNDDLTSGNTHKHLDACVFHEEDDHQTILIPEKKAKREKLIAFIGNLPFGMTEARLR